MITSSDIYWIMQMDSIIATSVVAAMMSLILSIAFLLVWVAEDEKSPKKRNRFFISFSISIIFLSVAAFIPTTKTLAAMYAVPTIVNSDKAKRLGGESIEVLELGLSKLKEVLESEKSNKGN